MTAEVQTFRWLEDQRELHTALENIRWKPVSEAMEQVLDLFEKTFVRVGDSRVIGLSLRHFKLVAGSPLEQLLRSFEIPLPEDATSSDYYVLFEEGITSDVFKIGPYPYGPPHQFGTGGFSVTIGRDNRSFCKFARRAEGSQVSEPVAGDFLEVLNDPVLATARRELVCALTYAFHRSLAAGASVLGSNEIEFIC